MLPAAYSVTRAPETAVSPPCTVPESDGAGVAIAVAVDVAVAVAVAVAVTVAVAVGVGLFWVAFPFSSTVSEVGPLIAPLLILLMLMVASKFLPGPLGMNSTSTSWLI